MKQEFKVGSKVKIVDIFIFSMNDVGDIGTVAEFDGKHGYRVNVENKPDYANWHIAEELKLIK